MVLNAVDHPVRLVAGDLYEPVAGEQFDLVVTLPPYVPTVPGSGTSETVAGGPDGLGLIRRVVGGAEEAPAPDGELVAASQAACVTTLGRCRRGTRDAGGGLDTRLVVSEWHPLQPYVVELATRLTAHCAGGAHEDRDALIARYAYSLRTLGVTGATTAPFACVGPGVPAAASGTWVVGRAPEVRSSDVPVPAVALGARSAQGLLAASVVGGGGGLVDGPTAALLRAADGERNVREVASRRVGVVPRRGRRGPDGPGSPSTDARRDAGLGRVAARP